MMTPEEFRALAAAQSNPPKKMHVPKKTIFIVLGIILIVLASVLVTLYFVRQNQLNNEVKTALEAIPGTMTDAAGDNGYPITLPATIANPNNVTLKGAGSFDGTTYCVTGTSKADKSIIYYIDSVAKKPQTGSCQTAANLPAPTTTGSPNLSIVSATQIRLSWNQASYASSYTIQCATDEAFTQNLSKTTVSTLSGACSNLKSATIYYVRVRGNNTTGGPWSPVITTTTDAWSSAPTNLKLTPVSATQINYSWSSVQGAISYIIEWANDTSFTKNVKTAIRTTTSGSTTGLNPKTVYYYHVKAITSTFDNAHAAYSATAGTLTL